MGSRIIVLCATLVVLSLAAACGSDSEDDGTSTTRTTSASSSGTSPSSSGTGTSMQGGGGTGAGAAGGTGGSGGGTGGSGGAAMSIPDPGNQMASTTWFDDNLPHGTPQTAKPEGVVTQNPVYIEGDVDPITGAYFYVFLTGPMFTMFSINLNEISTNIDFVHIHDGTGLMFGAEIMPSMFTSPLIQTWTLQPNTIYVLEIHSPGGGFF